jgi:hypothetical protein
MLSPGKFVECRRTMRPILIVRKTYEARPYYSASFVAGARSPIRSLSDTSIRRLVLVGPHSASGFIAPLHKLWEDDLISAPTPDAVLARGWRVDTVSRHQSVIDEVERDSSAIGAVGMFDGDLGAETGRTQTLLRYYSIPQDVIAVSPDLVRFAPDIVYVLTSMLERDRVSRLPRDSAGAILMRASTAVADVVPYTDEFRNAYTALIRMQLRVDGGAVPLKLSRRHVLQLAPVAALTGLGLIIIGFGIGRYVRSTATLPDERTRLTSLKELGLATVLISAWVFLFFFSKSYYVEPPAAFFLLLACSAFTGTMARRAVHAIRVRRGAPASLVASMSFIDELTAGLLLAFGVALLYIANGLVLFGTIAQMQEATAFARIAGTMSLLGFSAAFLLEESARQLARRMRESVRRDKPSRQLPQSDELEAQPDEDEG